MIFRRYTIAFIIAFLISYLVFLPVDIRAYDLEIEQIDVTIDVGEDNVYKIKEDISVNFYRSDMHGLYRDIPLTTYFGKPVDISQIKVTHAPYTSQKIDGNLRLKIGDPSIYAKENENYTIQYTYPIGDDRNESMDELYYNIIGLSWQIPIRNISFTIVMPYDFDKNDLNFTYGEKGSLANEDVVYTINHNVIRGSLNRELGPNEALTVALPLVEGYFNQVTKDVYIMDRVKPAVLTLAAFMFFLGLSLWIIYGKREILTPIIEFYPPQNLTPMDIGFVYDQKIDAYDLTAMLVFWADTGYIKFIEKEEEKGKIIKKKHKTISIEKLFPLPDYLSDYELLYFNDLFNDYGYNNIVHVEELKDSFYITLNKVKKMIKASYKKDEDKKIITDTSKKIKVVLGFLALVISIIVFLNVYHDTDPYDFVFGLGFALVTSVITSILTVRGSKKIEILHSRMLRDKVKNILFGVFFIGLSVLISALLIIVISLSPIYLFLSLGAQILLILLPYSNRLTPNGQALMNQLVGFKNFILHAQKDRINLLVEADPGYFYHILPYAMALGVTDKWAKQFEHITLEPPNWYESPYIYGGFSAYMFTNQLNAQTRSIGSSMSSTPSSSSSGGSFGGGSSGGGSGGGGGGGW